MIEKSEYRDNIQIIPQSGYGDIAAKLLKFRDRQNIEKYRN